jgi:hypothetical protein
LLTKPERLEKRAFYAELSVSQEDFKREQSELDISEKMKREKG